MKLTKKISGWLQEWGFHTDTRRKGALQKWKKQTEAIISLLEEEFDPLIARAIFNERYSSALYKLPDDVWLRIFTLLYQDEISFFIVRQVCRRFRRLLQSQEFRHHRFSPARSYNMPNSQNGGDLFLKSKGAVTKLVPSHAFLDEPDADAALRADICHLLHIDTYCADCLKYDKRRRYRKAKLKNGYCKFLRPGPQYNCHVCAASHPHTMFSRQGKKEQRCNGIKGHVRVCEHQTISWLQMRSFLRECKAKIPRKARQDFEVDTIMKACDHPDHLRHRTECHPFEVNGPVARLFYKKSGEWRVELTWEPHSGPGKFKLYQPGKFDAGEMRNLFLSYRSSAARFIVPELLPNHLPEMTCFRLNECACLSYGTDEEKVRTLLHGDEASLVQENIKETHSALDVAHGHPSSHQQPYEPSQRAHVRIQPCSQALSTQQATRSPCVVTIYKRLITGSCPGEPGEAMPSHDWFHAMDRASYSEYGHGGKAEACKHMDSACRNSYALGVLGCYDRDVTLCKSNKSDKGHCSQTHSYTRDHRDLNNEYTQLIMAINTCIQNR